MSGKTVMATAAILLGSTGLAPAQIVVFPQYSYWYGGGYYSPLTGTAVGERPPNNLVPGREPPGYNSRFEGWDHHWRRWRSQ